MRFLCYVAVLVLCWKESFNKSISYGTKMVPGIPGIAGDSARTRSTDVTFDLCNLFEAVLFSSILEAQNLSIQLSSRGTSAVDPNTLWKDYTEHVLSIFYFLGRKKRQDTGDYNLNSFGLRFGKRDTKFNWDSFGLRFGKKRLLPISLYKTHQILCDE